MVFMPHGMDRILGTHRSSLDLAIVPPMLGLVARAAITTPEGRQRYLERAGFLFTNLFQPERLSQRVREIGAKMAGDAAHAQHDADMLNAAAGIKELGADGAYVRRRRKIEQPFDPVRSHDFRIVVEENQEIATRCPRAGVAERRKIEGSPRVQDLEPGVFRLQRLKQRLRARLCNTGYA